MTANTKYCPVCNKPFPETETHCGCRRPPTALTAAPMIGKKLGNYIPFSLLGRGGMGEVYQARHAHLDEICAIKTILLDTVNDAQAVSRFLREAQLARALQSERIVRVLDYGNEPNGAEFIPYMALEWISGETLFELLVREKVLPVARAVNIAVQIGEALEVAHSHPSVIIHRDLKPGNVMVLPGDRVKVFDFGLAKATGSKPGHWNTLTVVKGLPMGTPMYFSPEQARFADDEIGPLSDLYALGLILYQMLTGIFPFQIHFLPDGNWDYQRLYEERKTKAPTPVPRALANGDALPEALCVAIMRALATNPADRFPTVREFINALRMFLPRPVDQDAPTPPHPKPVVNNFSAAQRAWELIEKSDDIGDFEDFLECFPDSEHAKLAAFHIRRLKRVTGQNPVVVVPPTEVVPAPADTGRKVIRVAEGIVPGGIEMVYIEPGFFKRGSTDADEKRWKEKLAKYTGFSVNFSAECPQRDIHISEGFFIGKYQVTQEQWRAVVKATKKIKLDLNPAPSYFAGVNLPVESVSWEDCEEFLARLTALKDGYEYRFPTEAEWEYACRAGTKEDYAGVLDEMGWYANNSGDKPIDANQCWSDAKDWADYRDRFITPNGNKPHPVGLKAPNAWDLYDMHGNVWEWCNDWYDEKAYGGGGANDPKGPDKGEYRVLRGGSWSVNASRCRSAVRVRDTPSDRNFNSGLRVVMIPART